MLLVIRGETSRLRGAFSFTLSVFVHGSVLAWVALAPLVPPARPNLYDQEIRPFESKIVWYNLRERLPEVTPAQRDTRPARARNRFQQTLVAGPADTQKPPQLIWTPAPEIETQQMLPAPNVVALASPARPVRAFTTPPDLIRAEAAAPALPDAPRIAAAEVKPVPLPAPERPKPREFAPPPESRPVVAKVALLTAPELTVALDRAVTTPSPLLPPLQPARRTFIPPVEAPHGSPAPPANLPAAPQVEATATADVPVLTGMAMARAIRQFSAPEAARAPSTPPASLPVAPQITGNVPVNAPVLPALARPVKQFTAPETVRAPSTQPASLPGAPQIVERAAVNAPVLSGMARPVKQFTTPAGKPGPAATAASASVAAAIGDAPPVTAANRTTNAAFAIVGLFPTRQVEIPSPKASQQAGFSAGPQPRPEGGDSSAEGSQLTVPGLFVREGARDQQPTLMAHLEPPLSPRNLAAAARSALVTPDSESGPARATRAATAPDPRLSGRAVYTVAIQMPNITSFSGSWIVWFAERVPLPGQTIPNMQAPSPLRKVDPKYITAAFDEKVEGKVRLAAVIRRDGHVERVELLQHLDTRLDQSSQEALAKWEFEPALRNGVPIDVDAVFEIPFHLAPKLPK